jgi:hypothetical protein
VTDHTKTADLPTLRALAREAIARTPVRLTADQLLELLTELRAVGDPAADASADLIARHADHLAWREDLLAAGEAGPPLFDPAKVDTPEALDAALGVVARDRYDRMVEALAGWTHEFVPSGDDTRWCAHQAGIPGECRLPAGARIHRTPAHVEAEGGDRG